MYGMYCLAISYMPFVQKKNKSLNQKNDPGLLKAFGWDYKPGSLDSFPLQKGDKDINTSVLL